MNIQTKYAKLIDSISEINMIHSKIDDTPSIRYADALVDKYFDSKDAAIKQTEELMDAIEFEIWEYNDKIDRLCAEMPRYNSTLRDIASETLIDMQLKVAELTGMLCSLDNIKFAA